MPPVKRKMTFNQLMRVRCRCGHTLARHHHGMGQDDQACPCLKCMECETSPTQMGCPEFHETGIDHPPEALNYVPVTCVRPPVEAGTETEILRPARQLFVEHGDFKVTYDSACLYHILGPNGLQDRGMSHEELIQLQQVTAKAIAKIVTNEHDRKNRGGL